MAEDDHMMVDAPVSPTEPYYLDTLQEPFKSACLKALPATSENTPSSSSDASSRLEKFELDIRSNFLNMFFETGPLEIVEKAGSFWITTLNVCLHLIHGATHRANDNPQYDKMTPRKLPILLMEDCLDAMSVEDAKQFWERYVEPSLDRPPHLFGDLLWKSSNAGHLPFLRVCNQFLRLLDTASEGDQGEWKGRIMTALSKGFSIADRSALKYWGSFHDSVTDYESEETFEKTKETTTAANTASKMDYSLYESFWSLQADFSNPNRIQVGNFIKKIKMVLEAMESAASRNPDSQTAASVPVCISIRYMTLSSLLPTQLATPDFRASVISQFLITASHLSSESPSLANAMAPLLARARRLLQADAPKLYHLLWETILTHREDVWRKWKKDKCPVSAFEPKQTPNKHATTSSAKNGNRLLMSGSLGSADDNSKISSGEKYNSLPLEELVDASKEIEKSIPTLEDHLEPYVEALDPESGIEAEYHPGNDPLYAWRAMRLYAKHQLPLLKQCRRPADLERITREWYRQRDKEIPGEMPTAPPDEDFDQDENQGEEGDADKQSEAPEEGDERHKEEEFKGNDRGQDDDASDGPRNEETHSGLDDVVMKETVDANDVKEAEKSNDAQSDTDSASFESSKDREEQESSRNETKSGSKDAGTKIEEDDVKAEHPPKDGGEAGSAQESAADSDSDNDTSRTSAVKYQDDKETAAEKKEENLPSGEKRGDPSSSERKDVAEDEDEGSESAIEALQENSGEETSLKKDEGGGLARRRDFSRKRKRLKGEDRDGNKNQRGPVRDDGDRDRRDHPRPGGGNKGGGRRDDGQPRGRGRHEDGPVPARGGRRDERTPSRGGRGGGGGGPLPRQDDGLLNRGGGGRHNDEPPPSRSGPAPLRLHDDGPPRGGSGRGGRRDDRRRVGGGDRRRGRDDSRYRGRR